MEIPEDFKKEKMYNWEGVFYYKNIPCIKVDKIIEGEIIDECGDRYGWFYIHSTGYISGSTICGDVKLKLTE